MRDGEKRSGEEAFDQVTSSVQEFVSIKTARDSSSVESCSVASKHHGMCISMERRSEQRPSRYGVSNVNVEWCLQTQNPEQPPPSSSFKLLTAVPCTKPTLFRPTPKHNQEKQFRWGNQTHDPMRTGMVLSYEYAFVSAGSRSAPRRMMIPAPNAPPAAAQKTPKSGIIPRLRVPIHKHTTPPTSFFANFSRSSQITEIRLFTIAASFFSLICISISLLTYGINHRLYNWRL